MAGKFPRIVPPFRRAALPLAFLAAISAPLGAQDTTTVRERDDSVRIHFVDADLRGVVQALSRYLPKPTVVSGVPGNRVSLEPPTPVPTAAVSGLLRGLVEAQNLAFEEDLAFIRIGPRPADGPSARPPVGPEHGADVRHVQEILGHAHLSTTARYTHVAIATLKLVHQRTHPAEQGAASLASRPPVSSLAAALPAAPPLADDPTTTSS